MKEMNEYLHELAQNYVLIAAAAVLFFGTKAIIGYFAFRQYNRKLNRLERQLSELARK